ncbi:MAG: RNase adapter RapZ [Elusimicrobia bacterium]|nr:RNase adapter RapZ [Elusimicrobiota bacterium]
MSGAGKSQVLKSFEDFGFYCVDNLPIALLPHFLRLYPEGRNFLQRVALGIDIREGVWLKDFSCALEGLRKKGFQCKVLFLEASDSALLQRFSETRHRHPLGKALSRSIVEERRRLTEMKALADKVIDTSNMTLGELKETLSKTLEIKKAREMGLVITSFGYKYGLPMDADLVMDVRFLPNPNYHPSLKPRTGLDSPVRRFLLKQPLTRKFLGQFLRFLATFLPQYIQEGKSYLTVAVGCTGGRHRSVAMAHLLTQRLKRRGFAAREFHRDLEKERSREP